MSFCHTFWEEHKEDFISIAVGWVAPLFSFTVFIRVQQDCIWANTFKLFIKKKIQSRKSSRIKFNAIFTDHIKTRHKWQSKRKGKTMWDKSRAVLCGCYLFPQSLFTPGLLALRGYNCFSSAYTITQWWQEVHTVALLLNPLAPELFQPPLCTKVCVSSRLLALKSILKTCFHSCTPLPYPRFLLRHKAATSLTLRRRWGAPWTQVAFWLKCVAHHECKLKNCSLEQWRSSQMVQVRHSSSQVHP